MPKVPQGSIKALHLTGSQSNDKISKSRGIKFRSFKKARQLSPLKFFRTGSGRSAGKSIHSRKASHSKPVQFLRNALGFTARAEKKEFRRLEAELNQTKETLSQFKQELKALPPKEELTKARKQASLKVGAEKAKPGRLKDPVKLRRLEREHAKAVSQERRASLLESAVRNTQFAVSVLESKFATHPLAQERQSFGSSSDIGEDEELEAELEQLLGEETVSSTDSSLPLSPDLDEEELFRQLEDWARSGRQG
ncbi:hypothetical protein ACWJJH_19885 [Endozoicomonadaceae bacterium StTr2]